MSDIPPAGAGSEQPRTPGAWILVAVLTVFAVAPLTYPGVYQTHSGPLAAVKAEHPAAMPHWVDGVTALRGEGDLPYLLLWPIRLASASGVVAVVWGYAVAFLLAAWAMYAWARHWLGAEGAVLAAAVYTYLPWHLGTVYVRGAYAEAWLWVLWPAVLWAVDQVAERHQISRRRLVASIVVGMICLASTFGTHPGLAVASLPLLAGYAAVRLASQRRLIWSVIAAAATAVLAVLIGSAAFWRLGGTSLSASDLLYPAQLLSPAWGATHSLPSSQLDESGWLRALPISFHLGLAAVALGIVALVLTAGRKPGPPQAHSGTGPTQAPFPRYISWYWVSAVVLIVLLTLRPAALIWRISGARALLSYPWQLLSVAGWPLAFLGGSTIRQDERLRRLPTWAGLVALVILASYPYVVPRFLPAEAGVDGSAPVALFQPAGTTLPSIMLLNVEVDQSSASEDVSPSLRLTLTWQCLERVEQDYTVFIHVLTADDEGVRAAQRDTRPCGGNCPTNSWQRGDVVVNRYDFGLGEDSPPPPYRLAVGLYLLETGERASIVGRDADTVYVDVP